MFVSDKLLFSSFLFCYKLMLLLWEVITILKLKVLC